MFKPEEHIRHFTKEEYLTQTRDFFQDGSDCMTLVKIIL